MQPEFSRTISVAEIKNDGLVQEIEAEPHECVALAQRFDIIALQRLRAKARVFPYGSGNCRLRVTFVADVLQSCVVTLDPVSARVSEEFELMFASAAGHDAATEEIGFDPIADDPPEPLEGDVIDIGECVAEHLALALDPYPRKADADEVLRESATVDTDSSVQDKPHPFAMLAALKDGTEADR